MKKFFNDFKEFISKGNIVDMAVGVIIGGAFGKIVTSLVNDIIMPLISLATGGISVADWKWVITPAVLNEDGTVKVAESALKYGNFIQTTIDFLIIAFCIFVMLRLIMIAKDKLSKKQEEEIKEEAAADPKPTTEELLTEIRDLLKKD